VKEPRASQRVVLAVFAFAVLAFSVGQTAFIPAIGPLAAALDISTTAATWAVTASLVSAAVLTPVFGRLSDMFGKRLMLLVALVAVAAGGVVSALGDDLGLIVVGRVLQGAGGGLFPACFGLVRDTFPARSRAGAVGILTAISALGAGLGPAMGGVIVDHGSYESVFWAGAVLGIVALVFALPIVRDSPHRVPSRVDWIGMVVLAAGVTAPLIGISKANTWGWTSGRTLALVAAGVLLLIGFVALERRVKPPLIDIETLRRPTVAITNTAALLIGFGMYSACLLIPLYAQTPSVSGYGFGAGAGGAGLLLVPGCTFMVVTGAFAGPLSRVLGTRRVFAFGAAGAAAGLVLLAIQHSSQLAVVGGSVVLFGGIGLAFAGMTNLIVDGVPRAQTGEATGMNALVRIVGAAVGAQVSIAILASSAPAGGLVTEGGYVTAFLAAAAVTALAAVAALALPKRDAALANPV
jgi:MFS family permease